MPLKWRKYSGSLAYVRRCAIWGAVTADVREKAAESTKAKCEKLNAKSQGSKDAKTKLNRQDAENAKIIQSVGKGLRIKTFRAVNHESK